MVRLAIFVALAGCAALIFGAQMLFMGCGLMALVLVLADIAKALEK